MNVSIEPWPTLFPSCVDCQTYGPCTYGNTADDWVSSQRNFPCANPGIDFHKFVATPTNCSLAPRIFAERYAPNTCGDASGCWVNAYMEKFVPTRFHGTYTATFKWAVGGANTRTPTVCRPAGVYVTPGTIQRLGATSNCGMNTSNFEIVCTTINGVAYFIVTIVWTPLIDATVLGPDFAAAGGTGCSGTTPPTAISATNLAWGTTFNVGGGFGPIGVIAIGNPAYIVRYRIPVSATPANQPCGIRLGTYDAYDVVNPSLFTTASLAASPTLTIS